jgi:protein gp37
MSKNTGISWTDHTHNFWWGCNEVSDEECGGCYARDQAHRYGWVEGGKHFEIWGAPHVTQRRILGDKHNREPYVWNANALRRGERECVFSESMSDLFEFYPDLDRPRQVAFRTIENTYMLDWKMLTKRPQLIARYVPKTWMEGGWPLNAWAGFSAGSQKFFDQRWHCMVDLPAPVIFVSHEPATGPINIEKLAAAVDPSRLWIITGGISGSRWRSHAMDPDWARYVRDQCREIGAAFFFKQHSAFKPGYKPELDGEQHHNWPIVPGVVGALGGIRRGYC